MSMVLIHCQVAPGAFSGELQFEIILNGEKHRGLAARRYVLTTERKPIGEVTTEVPALIYGRILSDLENGKVLVSIPDGEVVSVKMDKLVLLESRDVPVGS